jgi:hypothetical protein
MRDQDGGAAAFAREGEKRLPRFGCRDLVEMTERPVGKQNIGLHDEGPRDRDTLAHAAR